MASQVVRINDDDAALARMIAKRDDRSVRSVISHALRNTYTQVGPRAVVAAEGHGEPYADDSRNNHTTGDR